jgi:hypothetical protein
MGNHPAEGIFPAARTQSSSVRPRRAGAANRTIASASRSPRPSSSPRRARATRLLHTPVGTAIATPPARWPSSPLLSSGVVAGHRAFVAHTEGSLTESVPVPVPGHRWNPPRQVALADHRVHSRHVPEYRRSRSPPIASADLTSGYKVFIQSPRQVQHSHHRPALPRPDRHHRA